MARDASKPAIRAGSWVDPPRSIWLNNRLPGFVRNQINPNYTRDLNWWKNNWSTYQQRFPIPRPKLKDIEEAGGNKARAQKKIYEEIRMRVYNWFRNHARASTSGNGKRALLPTNRTRRKRPHEAYLALFSKEVMPGLNNDYDEHVRGLRRGDPIPDRLNWTNDRVKEFLESDEMDAETQALVDAVCEGELDPAEALLDETDEERNERLLNKRQDAVDRLTPTLVHILRTLSRQSGFKFALFAAGINPRHGQVQVLHFNEGETVDNKTWEESSPAYRTVITPAWADFSGKLFTEEEIDTWSYDITVPMDDDVEEEEEVPDYVLDDDLDGAGGEEVEARKDKSKKRSKAAQPQGNSSKRPRLDTAQKTKASNTASSSKSKPAAQPSAAATSSKSTSHARAPIAVSSAKRRKSIFPPLVAASKSSTKSSAPPNATASSSKSAQSHAPSNATAASSSKPKAPPNPAAASSSSSRSAESAQVPPPAAAASTSNATVGAAASSSRPAAGAVASSGSQLPPTTQNRKGRPPGLRPQNLSAPTVDSEHRPPNDVPSQPRPSGSLQKRGRPPGVRPGDVSSAVAASEGRLSGSQPSAPPPSSQPPPSTPKNVQPAYYYKVNPDFRDNEESEEDSPPHPPRRTSSPPPFPVASVPSSPFNGDLGSDFDFDFDFGSHLNTSTLAVDKGKGRADADTSTLAVDKGKGRADADTSTLAVDKGKGRANADTDTDASTTTVDKGKGRAQQPSQSIRRGGRPPGFRVPFGRSASQPSNDPEDHSSPPPAKRTKSSGDSDGGVKAKKPRLEVIVEVDTPRPHRRSPSMPPPPPRPKGGRPVPQPRKAGSSTVEDPFYRLPTPAPTASRTVSLSTAAAVASSSRNVSLSTAPDASAPDWWAKTRSYLRGVSDSDEWQRLIDSLQAFESRMGWPTGGRLHKGARPAQIGTWINRGRQLNKPLAPNSADLPAFITSWQSWYLQLNPTWRGTEWPLAQPDSTRGREWGLLRVAGPAGIFLVVLGLAWWLHANPDDDELLLDAIADVCWVLDNMSGSSS
ncbi:hypothetical protein EIP91_011274 [Steccherinum ochraceum]|uniref:Uncharacterized protein n=1 Tax=Steccherinum ochraceum TaxID=92696 RepID=A0A4R0QZU5_9APHY|nr:hypothetical protein EIP91_011274 [Steccherinum ochraceum]